MNMRRRKHLSLHVNGFMTDREDLWAWRFRESVEPYLGETGLRVSLAFKVHLSWLERVTRLDVLKLLILPMPIRISGCIMHQHFQCVVSTHRGTFHCRHGSCCLSQRVPLICSNVRSHVAAEATSRSEVSMMPQLSEVSSNAVICVIDVHQAKTQFSNGVS